MSAKEPNRVYYSLIWMGPTNYEWTQRNGSNWSSGRLEVSGTMGNPDKTVYAVPPMDTNDWQIFSTWLENFQSSRTRSLTDLVKIFEEYRGESITWLNKNTGH